MFESCYILDNNLLSDMSSTNIFSQWEAEFLTVLTVSFKSRLFFYCNEVQFLIFFLPWIMSLGLYFKKHHFTQGHLGFLLYFLLGIC